MNVTKKPTTLAGWQKLYPDAIRITAKANTFLSTKDLLALAYGTGEKGMVLSDRSHGTWSSKKGTIVNINVIVSKSAAIDHALTILEKEVGNG